MTWRKTGVEFDDQCADIGLSDHAYRTHMEAIGYLYRNETTTCLINKSALRRFASSERSTDAIKELVDHGFWKRQGSHHYELVHHADVIRDSLEAQHAKKERDKAAQRRSRERKNSAETQDSVSADVSADTRQTDRQTSKQLGGGPRSTCEHGVRREFWACSVCDERESA